MNENTTNPAPLNMQALSFTPDQKYLIAAFDAKSGKLNILHGPTMSPVDVTQMALSVAYMFIERLRSVTESEILSPAGGHFLKPNGSPKG